MRRYGFVLLPQFGLLSLAAAVDVMAAANQVLDATTYEAVLLSVGGGLQQAAGGPAVQTAALAGAGALDGAFIVSSGLAPGGDAESPALHAWLHVQAACGVVLGGIGSGAAVLAAAGLLGGHRATVHWPHIATLAQRHADVLVSQHWYEIDRDRLSCAGHQASRDLMIAWLAQQHGTRFGHQLAAGFGLERMRGRDERQRLPLAARLGSGSAKLAEAVALMEANLGEPLPTEEVARLVGVSRRQLERLFRQHLDALPSRWYLALRLERARSLLRQTSQSVLQVALGCGFASGPHFSNAYRTHFGHTPRDERSARAAAWRAQPAPGASP